MPINLISKIKSKNDGSFPTIEDVDIYGGYQVRSDIADRNSIPSLNRKEGMMVFVQDDSKYYTLSGGLTDGYWTEISFGGGSSMAYVLIEDEDRLVESGVSELIVSANTDSVTRTITLPATPTDGQEIIIIRQAEYANGTLIIDLNDSLIDYIISSWGFNSFTDSELHLIYYGDVWLHIYSRTESYG